MTRKPKTSGLTPTGTKVNRGPLKPAGQRPTPKLAPRVLGGNCPGVSLSKAGAAVRHPEQNADEPS